LDEDPVRGEDDRLPCGCPDDGTCEHDDPFDLDREEDR
jgi:hypothetical protein